MEQTCALDLNKRDMDDKNEVVENQSATSIQLAVKNQSTRAVRAKLREIVVSQEESYKRSNRFGSPGFGEEKDNSSLTVDKAFYHDIEEPAEVVQQDFRSKVKVTQKEIGDGLDFTATTEIEPDLPTEAICPGIYSHMGKDTRSSLDLRTMGISNPLGRENRSTGKGNAIFYGEEPCYWSKMSIQKETVLVTRIDGLDVMQGEESSVFKCYICIEVLPSMSEMQNHLSIHYKEEQNVNYECCFCDEMFEVKIQLREHMTDMHILDILG